MAKTTKRILAIVLAAMFIIAMIPMSAMAAETLTIKNENADFDFTVYKVATLDTATGKYTPEAGVADTIVTAINTANQTDTAFFTVFEAAKAANKNLGTSVAVLNGTSAKSYSTTTPGIYYAVVTAERGATTSTKNSVIVWPEYKNNAWNYSANTVDLAAKVNTGNDNVTKYFTDAVTADSKSLGQGDTVSFTLEADVVGSATTPVQSYVIWDKMSKGLTYNGDAKVYFGSVAAANDVTEYFTIATATADNTEAAYAGGTYFTFTAKDEVINPDNTDYELVDPAFYTSGKVYVVYTATVNNNAVVAPASNPNKDGLTYKNNAGKTVEKDGREVKVYTYSAEIYKVDGGNSDAPLAGATLALFSGSTEIARGTSAANGKVEFKKTGEDNIVRLAPGTYTVKEISAPANYALSTATVTITVEDDKTTSVFGSTAKFQNYPTKLPQTGGEGTMMFTIIGGSLIVLAGVLFVVVMRKRTAK